MVIMFELWNLSCFAVLSCCIEVVQSLIKDFEGRVKSVQDELLQCKGWKEHEDKNESNRNFGAWRMVSSNPM